MGRVIDSLGPVIRRTSVRALVLSDPGNRLLLARMRIPDRRIDVWMAPGGGVEADETWEECLVREVQEETGWAPANWQGPVWKRRHRFTLMGERYDQREIYYVVRAEQFAPTHEQNPVTHERELFQAFHWWSVDELKATGETFAPRQLPRYLERLVEFGVPAEPIDVGV